MDSKSELRKVSTRDQFRRWAEKEIAAGYAYKSLASSAATTLDISATINTLDELNGALDLAAVSILLTSEEIKENKHNNSYNRALLQTALESEQ